MGYSIKLLGEDGEPVSVVRHQEGSNFALGGTTDASIDITYNYSGYFVEHIDSGAGIRFLYGKRAVDCIDILEKAVDSLGKVVDDDYWRTTPGNAGHVLSVLLAWANEHPDAIFVGD